MIALGDSTKRRLGLALLAVNMAFAVATLVLSLAVDEPAAALDVLVLGTTFGVVTALTLRAQPQNGAVWALVWAFFFGVLSDLGGRIAVYRGDVTGSEILDREVAASPSELDLLTSIGLTAELVLWLPGIYLIAIHLLILFPGGQTTSNRWRAVIFVATNLIALVTVAGVVRLGPWQDTRYDELVQDTFGVFGPSALFQAPLQLTALAALVHLVRRYRRSSGEERLQFRWVVWALAIFIVNFIPYPLWSLLGVERLASTIALANIGVAFAIAIVKYRLYDIDVIVSKSVMYLGLLAAITAVYAAIVVGPLVIVGAPDSDQGPGLLLPIAATGVVAVMFEPIRSRMERWANRLVYGKRSTPHEVLSQVTSRLADAEGQTTHELAHLVAEGTGADQVVVLLATEAGLVPSGSWSGDSAPAASTECSARVPVLHEGERLGEIAITKPRNDAVTPADRELLEDVAAGAGLLLRNMRLNRELEARAGEVRESRRRLIEAQDRERHRLERNLHDGAQQQVVALKVKLGIAKTVAQREGADAVADSVVALADSTQDAVDALRRVAHGIYPPLLESEGLEPALRAVGRTSAIPIELDAANLDRYGRSTEETTYFCVIETLERARMSGATAARVEVAGRNGDLVTEIDLGGLGSELDLRAVADRLDAAGGTLTIENQPEGGRCVVSSLPIDHREGATT